MPGSSAAGATADGAEATPAEAGAAEATAADAASARRVGSFKVFGGFIGVSPAQYRSLGRALSRFGRPTRPDLFRSATGRRRTNRRPPDRCTVPVPDPAG